VAQGSDDAMYFANNHYLLRYDGVKWEKNMLPNKTIIRSIYVVDDKIFLYEFGYWMQIWEDVSLSKGKAVLTIVKMKKSGRFLNLYYLFPVF
jgi:hypothetical protein